MKIKIFLIVMFCICITVVNAGEEKTKIVVGSAPSVKEVIEKAAEIYMKNNPDVEIKFSYASSGAIQNQIENGAPIDIFIAVGGKQMNAVDEKGMIVKVTRSVIAADELVAITDKNSKSINKIEDLLNPNVKLIANGEPGLVPCAKTVEESLKYLNKYEEMKPKFVYAKDLPQVLAYVESGNVDAGFVWNSTAKKSDKIKIIFKADEKMHKTVLVEAAVINSSKNKVKSEEFIKILKSKEMASLFIEKGFKK